ncbi:MAG: hypothetical protein ACREV0_07805 [Burkholderiales bacterium]
MQYQIADQQLRVVLKEFDEPFTWDVFGTIEMIDLNRQNQRGSLAARRFVKPYSLKALPFELAVYSFF